MIFKGTKGVWSLKLHDGKYCKVINKNNETICNINSKSTLKIKEEQANAQLISCAPEMLELLNFLSENVDMSAYAQEKINDLINKATTI